LKECIPEGNGDAVCEDVIPREGVERLLPPPDMLPTVNGDPERGS
jgi:hypothetical protein